VKDKKDTIFDQREKKRRRRHEERKSRLENLDEHRRIVTRLRPHVIKIDRKMVFDAMCEEQRKQFFRQNYGAHLPG